MSSSYIDDNDTEVKAPRNNITVAYAYGGKYLTKIVYPGGEKAYDHAYHHKFFNKTVESLTDIVPLVKRLLYEPHCCFIRGVCIDDTIPKQRRLKDETIIEQPQNWFALDIDGFGECSGNLRNDAKSVLLALGLHGCEAIAVPSAGYLRKPGIRIRLFLWNNVRVTCGSLKKHFSSAGNIVDLALFDYLQPIYVARPVFQGCDDPCAEHFAWITGNPFTEIKEQYVSVIGRREELYTKKQAERFFDSFLQKLFEKDDVNDGERHRWLFGVSVACGKWIYQGLLDEEETIETLYLATAIWKGDRRKDLKTIQDGIQRGKRTMERDQ